MTETHPIAPPTSGARRARVVAGALAILFGAATLLEGGHVLFGGPAARAEAGAVVPFVLWFNFTAAFAYVAAGAGAAAGRGWAGSLARLLAAATALVFAAFAVHVATGGAFERRTVVAMTVRTLFWAALAVILPRLLRRAPAAAARGAVAS
jgi:hypothetical protein